MPDIEVKCPSCNQILVAPDDMAGQKAACESCRAIIDVPLIWPPPLPASKNKANKSDSSPWGLFIEGIKNVVNSSRTTSTLTSLPPKPRSYADSKGCLDPVHLEDTSAKPEPIPHDTITSELLHEMEWKRFEEVVAKLFEMNGVNAELTRIGADGGVDINLYQKGSSKPVAIVQCKAWNKYTIGVKPVRELFGVMAAAEVSRGYFITSGEFTSEARSFAEGKKLKLMAGRDLLEQIDKLSDEQKQDLYNLATYGDYTTPSCPSCGRKLVKRVKGKGRNSGESFWGCSKYPKCHGKMRISTDQTATKSNWDYLKCL